MPAGAGLRRALGITHQRTLLQRAQDLLAREECDAGVRDELDADACPLDQGGVRPTQLLRSLGHQVEVAADLFRDRRQERSGQFQSGAAAARAGSARPGSRADPPAHAQSPRGAHAVRRGPLRVPRLLRAGARSAPLGGAPGHPGRGCRASGRPPPSAAAEVHVRRCRGPRSCRSRPLMRRTACCRNRFASPGRLSIAPSREALRGGPAALRAAPSRRGPGIISSPAVPSDESDSGRALTVAARTTGRRPAPPTRSTPPSRSATLGSPARS